MRVNFFSALGLILVAGLSSACSDRPVGSKQRPFALFFVPSVDAGKLATNGEKLSKFVSRRVSQGLYGKDDGFYVKTAIPTSYVAVVEALGTKKADFVIFTTYAYILARDIKGYPVDAVFTVLRGPKAKATTGGQIIVRTDSGINKVEDLNGKKFAFVDPASTTGFVLPSKLLKDKGVVVGQTVFGQKHDNVVTMVYQGQVDGGAVYHQDSDIEIVNGKPVERIRDARARVMTQFPDVDKKVKIIALTPEIPGEPWAIRTNLFEDAALNEKVRDLVTKAVFDFSSTEDGKVLLEQVATGVGLSEIKDSDYNGIREMVKDAQVNIQEVIAGQKK